MRRASVPCFFFNDTATTEIYTLSLHDALPISATRRPLASPSSGSPGHGRSQGRSGDPLLGEDRKSTRLNSSHQIISYAVFCLKKKNTRLPCSSTRTAAIPSSLRYFFTLASGSP